MHTMREDTLTQSAADSRRALWHIRDLRIVFPARLLLYAADTFVLFALTLGLHDSGGGTGQMALLLATFALPVLLASGTAGALADRFPSRRLIVVGGLTQAAAAALLMFTGHGPAMYVLVVLFQLGHTVLMPAWTALLPRVVGEERLGQVMSLQQGAAALVAVLAAAAAGVVSDLVGTRGAIAMAVGALLVLTGSIAAVRTVRIPDPDQAGPRVPLTRRLVSAHGWSVLRADTVLPTLLLAMVPFVLVFEMANVVGVFLVRDALAGSMADFGIFEAVTAAGSALGAVLASRARAERTRLMGAVGAIGAGALGMAGMALAPSLAIACVFSALLGAAVAGSGAILWSSLLLRTPDADRGRVSSAVYGLTRVTSLLALGAGALAGQLLGPRGTVAVGAVIAALVTAAAWARLRPILSADAADGSASTLEPAVSPTGRA